MIWRCPNCGTELATQNNSWRCALGHSFDKAKQGYVNLLLPNQKNSSEPGDNQAMVLGRRRFLQAGHYQPLVETIAGLVRQQPLDAAVGRCLLDLGCGEGYYLHRLQQLLDWDSQAMALYGLDISREAIKRAATLLPMASFCVASSYRIPAHDHSVDLALQIFAPVAEEEVQRVLTKDGLWLRVSPGPRHLYQLKAALYDNVREHDKPRVPAGFQLVQEQPLAFRLTLQNSEVIADLLAMTPFAWHGSHERRQALQAQQALELEVEFIVQLMTPEQPQHIEPVEPAETA